MANKFSKVLSVVALSGLMLAGCSKDFLNEPKPSSAVAPADVYGSDAGVRSFFNGIYRKMRTQYGSSTDAWGITAVNLAREVKGTDVVLPTSNWYSFDYAHDNREPNYRRTGFTWTFFYDFVNAANNMIAGVEASSLSEGSKKAFIAEAKALRAWCYFELVREFAHTYSKDPNAPGVPLYTTPTEMSTSGNKRSTVKEVYDQILADLTTAVPDLPVARQMKDVINQNVANGLLARVYLEKGDYTNAAAAAVAARTGLSLSASNTYGTPMVDIAKTEVMWGFPQAADQTIYYGSPSAFWGLSSTPGYYNFYMDSTFVNTFSTTDTRYKTFYRTGNTDFRRWKSNKFGNATSFTDHIIMMRVPEMYLIEAEAKARLGDATAADALFAVQSSRDAAAVKSTSTGETLISEILLEKRKELYGEIGISYLDIKRLQLPLIRSVGHPSSARLSIPANDNRFVLKIPQAEMDANKALTAADQNP